MANCVYDLDTTGGLMDKIQALIAPPDSDKKKEKKSEHPYFRRPGKGHNHDLCDACGEGGDLICCDKCPSSFHLGCHDPPLDFDDIPRGDWLCHSCKHQKLKDESNTATIAVNSPATTSNLSDPSAENSSSNPFDVLIDVASSMNPKQFELPKDVYVPNSMFPGGDKENPKLAKKFKQKEHDRQQNGSILLPAKKCCECRKSCRVGILVACDFCPLYYHLDCLDPPLTAPPTTIWMCPQHVEHTLDSNILTSVSLCERVSLWDKFSGPVDQDSIKLEFFRKIHNKNPPFRFKKKLTAKPKVQVPDMIKYHYRNPVSLLPSLKDVLRLENVLQRKRLRQQEKQENCNTVQDDSLKSEKQRDETENLTGNERDEIRSEIKPFGSFIKTDNEESDSLKNPEKPPLPPTTCINITNNSFYTNNIVNVNVNCGNHIHYSTRENGEIELSNGYYAKELLKKEETVVRDIMDSYVAQEIELELKHFDDRLIKVLAYQRLEQILSNEMSNKMPSELLSSSDIDRICRIVENTRKKSKPKLAVRVRAILCPVVSKYFYNVRTHEVDPTDVRHDASFSGYRPTVSVRFPSAVSMRYRILNVGKGAANDVDLEKFGTCNYIVSKHATIFFDDYTKSYELINYAPYGTSVNGVLYSNKISIQRSSTNNNSEKDNNNKPTGKGEISAIVETQMRDVIRKRKLATRSDANYLNPVTPRNKIKIEPAKMAADAVNNKVDCSCSIDPNELGRGWEGSALLSHGSLVKFGCIGFVFSIVDSD